MYLFIIVFFIYLCYVFYFLSRKLFFICKNYNLMNKQEIYLRNDSDFDSKFNSKFDSNNESDNNLVHTNYEKFNYEEFDKFITKTK
jgi:hypothetical protein